MKFASLEDFDWIRLSCFSFSLLIGLSNLVVGFCFFLTWAGSFFHVDGVGLVDENVVRSHPWMLNSSQPASAAPATGAPFLSTQPQNPGTAGTAGTNAGGPVGNGMVLSTNPVPGGAPVPPPMQMPPIAPGMPVILDGLTNAPHFNGISAVVESFDVETNRYNVQLPIMDPTGGAKRWVIMGSLWWTGNH